MRPPAGEGKGGREEGRIRESEQVGESSGKKKRVIGGTHRPSWSTKRVGLPVLKSDSENLSHRDVNGLPVVPCIHAAPMSTLTCKSKGKNNKHELQETTDKKQPSANQKSRTLTPQVLIQISIRCHGEKIKIGI